MPCEITVLYPNPVNFKMDYYMSTHMPLVQDKWKSHGLKSWRVVEFTKDDKFAVQATLLFDSKADFQKAVDAEGATVMGDIPNFADVQPVILTGDVKGTS